MSQQEGKSWLAFTGVEWIVWKPLPGLEPSLGESAMWVGSLRYAKEKTAGKPETECQCEAENAAFEFQYCVVYK